MDVSRSIERVLFHTVVGYQPNYTSTYRFKVLQMKLGGGCCIAGISNLYDDFPPGIVDSGRGEDALRVVVLQYCVEYKFVVEPRFHAVAIHLRKGKDYLESELMGKNLCGADYYMAAIDYIKAHVDNPVFYVFTDNPSWLKDNMPSFGYTLVDWNEVSGKRSFRDMQLMSCAKHNIIGNSTYSWWGAWLNPNPDKIVIAPDKFFNVTNDFFAKQDIVCEDWIRL